MPGRPVAVSFPCLSLPGLLAVLVTSGCEKKVLSSSGQPVRAEKTTGTQVPGLEEVKQIAGTGSFTVFPS